MWILWISTFDIFVEGVGQIAVVLDVDWDDWELLLPWVATGAPFADLLVGENTSQYLGHPFLMTQVLQSSVNEVDEENVKLNSVLDTVNVSFFVHRIATNVFPFYDLNQKKITITTAYYRLI